MFQKWMNPCVFSAAWWETPPGMSTLASTHTHRVLSGDVPRTKALARWDCKPALAMLHVLEKHRDVPHNCCLPCACLLYFPFVYWSGNHRLIPVRSCKCLPLLDQTQKNSSRWLQCIYIPQVITRWCSPLYSFPHVKAKILVHFSFFSNISSIF